MGTAQIILSPSLPLSCHMVKTEYPCKFCGQMFRSRQAKTYHENHACLKNPEFANPPAEKGKTEQAPPGDPPTPTPDELAAHRAAWEAEHGPLPAKEDDEPDLTVEQGPSEEEDDNSIWLIIGIIVVSVFVGAIWLLKDSILAALGKTPPLRKTGPIDGGVKNGR